MGLADLGHGFFGEVAAFVGGPFVVGVGQDGADEADDGRLRLSRVRLCGRTIESVLKESDTWEDHPLFLLRRSPGSC